MSLSNRNSLYFSLSNSLNSITSLFLSVSLAKLFYDKQLFGEFFQIFMVVNLFLSCTSGIPLALNFFFGKYKKYSDRFNLIGRLFYFTLLTATVISFFSFFLSDFLRRIFDNDLFIELKLFFLFFLFFKLLNSFFANFNLLLNKSRYFLFVTFTIFTCVILFISCSIIFSFSYRDVFIGLLAIEILRFLLLFLKLIKYKKIKSVKNLIFKLSETKYIITISIITLVNTANVFVDKYMISYFMNPEAFADYQVASFTIPFISIISGSIITALIPDFSRLFNNNELSKMVKLWRGATKEITVLLLPIFVFCIFFGQEIIVVLYGVNFKSSGQLFQIYSFRFLGSVVLFSITLGAIGLQNWILINSIIALLLNFILNYFLISDYGVMGAILSTIISTYCSYFIIVYITKLKLKVKFSEYFPIKFYLTVSFVSVVIILPMKLISSFNFIILAIEFCFFYTSVMIVIYLTSKTPIPIFVAIKDKLIKN